MNNVVLVGNLTRDPVLRTTPNGHPYCNFTVACQRKYKNAEGNRDCDFVNCVAWRKTAEFVCKYFAKGRKIGLQGSIQTRKYDQEGQTHFVAEVVVDNAEFVAPRSDGSSGYGAPGDAPAALPERDNRRDEPEHPFTDDEMPFQPLSDAELPF